MTAQSHKNDFSVYLFVEKNVRREPDYFGASYFQPMTIDDAVEQARNSDDITKVIEINLHEGWSRDAGEKVAEAYYQKYDWELLDEEAGHPFLEDSEIWQNTLEVAGRRDEYWTQKRNSA